MQSISVYVTLHHNFNLLLLSCNIELTEQSIIVVQVGNINAFMSLAAFWLSQHGCLGWKQLVSVQGDKLVWDGYILYSASANFDI